MKTNRPRTARKRSYDTTARAQAAQERAERCVELFADMLRNDWYRDITLERVAEEAGITVPTVLRYFGSKEGLLRAAADAHGERYMTERKAAPVGDVPAIVRSVVEGYERRGDFTIRMLVQEERIAALQEYTERGRREHRKAVRYAFAPYLEGLGPAARARMLDELTTALDVYVWKVLRRDRKRSPADVRGFMETAVNAILAKHGAQRGGKGG